MSQPERPPIRMWSWGTMPPVGKRAFVLKMARSLLDQHGVPVPGSWMSAWAAAARGLWEASPEEARDVETFGPTQVRPRRG